jgi:hypothetical protein
MPFTYGGGGAPMQQGRSLAGTACLVRPFQPSLIPNFFILTLFYNYTYLHPILGYFGLERALLMGYIWVKGLFGLLVWVIVSDGIPTG